MCGSQNGSLSKPLVRMPVQFVTHTACESCNVHGLKLFKLVCACAGVRAHVRVFIKLKLMKKYYMVGVSLGLSSAHLSLLTRYWQF